MKRLTVAMISSAWMLSVGCSPNVVQKKSPLVGLDAGVIYVEPQKGSASTDVYTLVYVVEVPPEAAWEAAKSVTKWLSGLDAIDDVQTTSTVHLPDDEVEEHLDILWSDGKVERAVLQLDEGKGLIDLTVDPGDPTAGHLAHVAITMSPYRRHGTLVEAEVEMDQDFMRRLTQLILLPLDLLTGGGLHEDLKKFCLHMVNRHRQESVRVVERSGEPTGRTHVVAIGVEIGNDEAGWGLIDYAEEDAQRFFDWAERAYPRDGDDLLIRELIKTPNATDARISAVLHELEDEERVRRGDTILFFFAGHVGVEADLLQPEHDLYLLTVNSQPGNLRATAIKPSLVLATLRFSNASRCVFVCDACYAGGMRTKWENVGPYQEVFRGPRDRRLPFRKREQAQGEAKVAILAASRADQRAIERADIESGVFTYAMLKGLEGEADQNGDRWISLKELEAFVTEEVQGLTNNKQSPYFDYSDAVDMFFKVAPQPTDESSEAGTAEQLGRSTRSAGES